MPKAKAWTGKRIKGVRQALGLTQRELADFLGYKHENRITEMENGKRIMPTAETKLMLILETTQKGVVTADCITHRFNEDKILIINARMGGGEG